MATSLALFRLLAYLAAGGLVALACIQAGQVSRGFFRFSAALYAGLLAIALVVRPEALALGASVFEAGGAGAWPGPSALAVALLAAAALLAGTQAALVPVLGTGLGRGILRASAVVGAAGVVAEGFGAGGLASAPWPAFAGPVSAALSALLLGSALTAMTLGHWYLVLPKLSPAPLYRLAWLYAGSVAARAAGIVVVLALLYLYGGRAFDRFAADAGMLLWPRLLFGIVVPAVLAVGTLPAVRARDTQPATGMLYVACVMVLVGEGLGLYLSARTGIPV